MRLTRLQIRNFRLLRRSDIALSENDATTVLVGPNNSGKTSVMDAIRLFSHRGGEGRKRIKIHDFSKSRRKFFDHAQKLLEAAGEDEEKRIESLQRSLPIIRIGMTFEYSDTPVDLNLIRPLLMDLSPDQKEVTVRVEFAVDDALNLANDFRERRNPGTTTLYDILADDIHSYYGFVYSKVSPDGLIAQRLDDGAVIAKLIRVDMTPAQRHIDDEEAAQAAKLSKLLHAHYATYVREADKESFDDVEDAIRESSNILTGKYQKVFEALLNRLQSFGYPQGNAKPELTIRAEMDSQTIYRDNTRIYYAAPDSDGDPSYDLPERYNGLGYKNLIFIVLQLESFRAAIESEPKTRPGVHLIGIEEPEAHLHPQMQSVFIQEIGKVLDAGEGSTAQVLLSTHSPRMVADSGFAPIRYFKRTTGGVAIKDLAKLKTALKTKKSAAGIAEADVDKEVNETLAFLRRYVKLAHCDLLFADKAILVEGQVEKLLMPAMIEQVAADDGYESLATQYVTVLEIGGAYAHKIEPLLDFIGLPTLVVADIDSAKKDRTKCPVAEGVISTNAVLKHWLPEKKSLDSLLKTKPDEKIVGRVGIAYQIDEAGRCGRSFEEAFIYANLDWLSTNTSVFSESKSELDNAVAAGLADAAYELGQSVGKVDFALDLITAEGWAAPTYIKDGLKWLALAEPLT